MIPVMLAWILEIWLHAKTTVQGSFITSVLNLELYEYIFKTNRDELILLSGIYTFKTSTNVVFLGSDGNE